MPGSATRANALDHVVVVLFENRSLDNVLGRLYGPGDGKTFEGVIGKELSNPIPEWAEHGADRKVVPYGITADMDSPNPDSGEEWYHTNTQLFGTIDDHNRSKIGEGVTEPWNAPPPGATPSMDGFVTDYISTFTGEVGRQPAYAEYAQIMTGYTPDQLPVLSGIAREFGVFDHWFSEVPSQTFMNRSFWTAATSSGLVVNSPVQKVVHRKRRGDDLRAARAARQDLEGLRDGADVPVVHRRHPLSPAEGPAGDALRAVLGVREGRRGRDPARLRADRAGHDRRARRLPPGVRPVIFRRQRRHRAGPVVGDAGRRGVPGAGVQRLPVRHLTGRRQRLEHHPADRVGRAGRNLRPRAPRAGPAARPGRPGGRVRLHLRPLRLPGPRHRRLALGRAGLGVQPGVPAHLADRHAAQDLAPRPAFTQRDAAARTFDHIFTRETPRDPQTWATVAAQPVPAWAIDYQTMGKALGYLGKDVAPGIIEHARQMGLKLPPQLDDPAAELTPQLIVEAIRDVAFHYFPRLAPADTGDSH